MITARRPYFYKTRPYLHQDLEYANTWNRPYYALWWEMGTGKSKPIIDTCGRLYCEKEIDGVILVGDKGNYRNWVREIDAHLCDDVPRRVAVWSSAPTTRQISELEKVMTAQDDVLDFLLINVEALSSSRAEDVARRFIKSHYVLMCVDEATSIKNPRAMRTKAAKKLGALCDYRRVLTGTPVTQGPLDVYSMCDFLSTGCVGFTNFTSFKAHHANVIRINLGPGRPQFDKIIGYRNLNELTNRLDEFSSRITKEMCLDLPERVFETIDVDLTPEQQDAYDNLRQMAVVQLDAGLLTSTSALTTINKLQQIVCGHVKIDDKSTVDLPNNRIDVLVEIIDKIGPEHQVIVWCAFQRDVQLIMQRLMLEKITAIEYYGLTAERDREANLDRFLRGESRVFVGTQATGGKGLTLNVADYAVYYSSNYSLEDRLQSQDRNHRIGQTKKCTYIDLVARGTIDEKILRSHEMKKDLAHQVLDNMRDLLT